MRPSLALLLPLLACTGCTFYLGRAAADRASGDAVAESPAASPSANPSATSAAAPAGATTGAASANASHERQCSQLRADIASSQHNQRAAAPGTQTPIIAAASTGKEDQRIEALQKRYEEMGCVAVPGAGNASRPVPRAP